MKLDSYSNVTLKQGTHLADEQKKACVLLRVVYKSIKTIPTCVYINVYKQIPITDIHNVARKYSSLYLFILGNSYSIR